MKLEMINNKQLGHNDFTLYIDHNHKLNYIGLLFLSRKFVCLLGLLMPQVLIESLGLAGI
jgi:hypothetical protein